MSKDTKIVLNRKQKLLNLEYEKLSKEELIEKIIRLEAHNKQLKNILGKKLKDDCDKNKFRPYENKKKFDFSKSHRRHTLLKFLYFGWDYQGYVLQEDTNSTIEFYIFNALQKTCLIESRENSNYHRCGRTDKEVSAFCQVISIDMRSNFPEDKQMSDDGIANEIDYCKVLNNVLPSNIKCLSWMPLYNKLYSARFDCDHRTYKYFFPRGNLDIKAMQLACKYLVGIHDFRNLCKMDVANGVTNYMRTITSAEIQMCRSQIENNAGYEMYNFRITGQAFLWHQIRCIMAILILVGEKNESPQIISELLNIDKNPCKPQYSLADGKPLNLYCCEFRTKSTQNEVSDKEIDTTEWIYTEENLTKVVESLQLQWSNFNIRATMTREIISDVQGICFDRYNSQPILCQAKVLQQGVKSKQYQQLLKRKRCESLENRMHHYIKKQRLTVSEIDNSPSLM